MLTPEEAFQKYGRDAVVLVAIYNPTPLRNQLQRIGFTDLVPYVAFFWEHAGAMQEETRLESPERILHSVDAMQAGYRRLSDDRSRVEFASQVAWRCAAPVSLPEPDSARDMYFAHDVVTLSGQEVFVDCGAFDGDTIRMFCERTRGAFQHIYALEPGQINRERLERFLATWPSDARRRVSVLPFAAGAVNGRLAFTSDGTVGAHVSSDGTVGEQIECRTLDGLLSDRPVTFIKLDIEGAEIDALRGAATLIRRARPVVAACAYHACDHLWRLPEVLAEIVPDYRIVLRRYAEDCWETLYYAVPPERGQGEVRSFTSWKW